MPKLVLLWTDIAIWLLVCALIAYALYARRQPDLASTWRKVFADKAALASGVVLAACLLLTLADSLHFRSLLPPAPGAPAAAPAYDVRVRSLLDVVLRDLVDSRESTYSRPLAYVGFTKESQDVDGKTLRVAPRLVHGGAHLTDPAAQWAGDVARRIVLGLVWGIAAAAIVCALFVALLPGEGGWRAKAGAIWRGETQIPWRVAAFTLTFLFALGGVIYSLMGYYHPFGTDVTGNDVLLQTLKSIRTAFVIGTLATLATLPFAVVLGIMAGYLKGWADEAIQYVYTLLSSIPNILLIAALVLMVQVFIDTHPDMFETGVERADVKLFLLCVVLGVTGWPGLCRLLRGETLKLRELEYVQAANAFGVSNARIMVRHIFPNVAHLMLIVTVLDFSTLILYEAVLSYVGVGVDPSMNSFGGMINFSRNEMSRDPIVWWPFSAAFAFMVALVLAVNLFADGVRDAFDPRSRAYRPRKLQEKLLSATTNA
ncbi:MAG TPA: ABC transporter permease [Burkholderiaceae bacterium]|nr:ABC transporter permease [Burkholderiaceae bacterium]HRP27726.1 ABC transporter permease [Burkholderiaceae bacterium]